MARFGWFDVPIGGNPQNYSYSADQMRDIWRSIMTNGIVPEVRQSKNNTMLPDKMLGSSLSPLPGDGLNLAITSGIAFIDGAYYVADAVENVPLQKGWVNDVVLRLDLTGSEVVYGIFHKQREASSIEKGLTRGGGVYELGLCSVNVPANCTQITKSMITDHRLNMAPGIDGKPCCGIVGSLITPDIDEWYRSATQAQREWFDSSQAEFEEWEVATRAGFDSWFRDIQNTLDGDIVTNLLNKINKNATDIKGVDNKLTSHAADTSHVFTLAHSLAGTVHKLTGTLPDTGYASIRFKATAAFSEGNTFSINGVVYTAKPVGEETALPANAFITGDTVTAEIDVSGKKVNFKPGGGGSFPDGWKKVVTAEAFESIAKNASIVKQNYGNWDTQINSLPSPAELPTGGGWSTAFSPDGLYLAVGHSGLPCITIYKRSGDTFTKLPNPSQLPTGAGMSTAFSPDGLYLAVGHSGSPFITIYKRNGDTFTKLPNPSQLPTSTAWGIAFSLDGLYLAVAHGNSPYITIYKRNGDTFTKLPNPSQLPTEERRGTAFSPDGLYLSVVGYNSPYIIIYKRNGDTFTKLPNPSQLPTGIGNGTAFSPDGLYFAVVHDGSPYITIYKRNGDTFTKLPNPSQLPIGIGNGTAFSPDGLYLAVAHLSSPYITIYKRNGDTFTKLPNPSQLPTSTGWGTAFSPDGLYLAVGHYGSPYITIYRTQSKEIIRNATQWSNSPLYWLPQGEFGISLQNAAINEQCKVNLFPILNNIQ